MRRPTLLLSASLLAAACGGDELSVSGSLVPGSGATEVFVLGGADRAAVQADSFLLQRVTGDTLDLRFAAGEDEPARMQIVGLPDGGKVRLEGIWLSDGVAHVARVHAEGADGLTVNGFRMRDAASIPGELSADATVLAVSREADALLVRPTDAGLPDLRVVVTPGTRIRTRDGGPGDTGGLEFGDSLRVAGEGVDGYVVATELVLDP